MFVRFRDKEAKPLHSIHGTTVYGFQDDVLHYCALTDDMIFSVYLEPCHWWFDVVVPVRNGSRGQTRTPAHNGLVMALSFATSRRYSPDYGGLMAEVIVNSKLELCIMDEKRFAYERAAQLAKERHKIVAMIGDVYVGRAQSIESERDAMRVYRWTSPPHDAASGPFGSPRGPLDWERHAEDAHDLRAIRNYNALVSPRPLKPSSFVPDNDTFRNDHCMLPFPVCGDHLRLKFFNLGVGESSSSPPYAECVMRLSHEYGGSKRRSSAPPTVTSVAITNQLEVCIYYTTSSVKSMELRAKRGYHAALTNMAMYEAPNTI